MVSSTDPAFTASCGCTAILTTRPARRALHLVLHLHVASTTNNPCPAVTSSTSATSTRTIFPCIGAFTAYLPDDLRAAPAGFHFRGSSLPPDAHTAQPSTIAAAVDPAISALQPSSSTE